jgi:hypothetical protein
VNGAEFTVAVSLAAGTAIGTANTAGFELSVTATLEAGAPGGDVTFSESGFDLVVSMSLSVGSAVVFDPDLYELFGDDLLKLTD